ncbi:PREDICTED: general transcription factor 3C polypeptide 3 [Nicrophorus vespilloides]|uniref:General transcription factor 3C polypeptide 3 n=1 Tax=Nicrophorus vespilloides TaxID=110193 RepID=A0ABM1NDX9_NICVS|nr:PREDICTED: general transcription factor 3C polypeptide 3 [Nicrophorus vespilloides]
MLFVSLMSTANNLKMDSSLEVEAMEMQEYNSEDSQKVVSSDEEDEEGEINENIDEDYANELDFEDQKKKKWKIQKSKLPIHLKGLMGEANLRFARGDCDLSEKMCYEVIRQQPHAYEPYVTLCQIYENKDDDKMLQYLSIAAHLKRGDVDQWMRLGQLYITRNNIPAAVTCYSRAVSTQPDNYEIHLKRIQLLELLKDHKFVIKAKIKLLNQYKECDHDALMDLAKELAEYYHKEKDYAKAIEMIEIPFKKCKQYITPELVNIYLELLILMGNFPNCLDIFVQYCNIEMEILIGDDQKVEIISYTMRQEILIDLQIKFIICLVHLESYDLVDKLVNPLLDDDNNAENIGDLFLDVAEAMMKKKQHMKALKLLVPLIKSKNFSLAAVWLKYAECQRECNMDEQAIESYYTVVRLAPQHIEVKIPLSDLLLKVDKVREALKVLRQNTAETNEVDVPVAMKRMRLLMKIKKNEELYMEFETFLRRHCLVIAPDEAELRILTFRVSVREKLNKIRELRNLRDEDLCNFFESSREPSVEEEYDFFLEIMNYSYVNRHFEQMKRFVFNALSSTRFKNYTSDLHAMVLYACMFLKEHSWQIAKQSVSSKNGKNNLLWNIYNQTMLTFVDSRQNRFLMLYPNLAITKVLEANIAVSSGMYKIAIIHLLPLLKNQPTPFVYLLLGSVFLQVTNQKRHEGKKDLTQCTYGLFHNYAKNRGKLAYQEVCYNLGRLYHQYGILHLAKHYYLQCLEYTNSLIDEYPEILNLQREAAFNLCLIYRDSENFIGARNIMIKYLTI